MQESERIFIAENATLLRGSERELNRQLFTILNSIYDGLYITDGQANTILINRAYEEVSGLRREDVLGKSMQEIVATGMIDRSGSLGVLKTRKPVTLEQTFRTGKQALITSTPHFDSSGEITMIITVVRDMTEIYGLQRKYQESEERRRSEMEFLQRNQRFVSRMVAADPRTLEVLARAQKVAALDTTILLLGETGVGKEQFARYIYENSARARQSFIGINCGAIPASLIFWKASCSAMCAGPSPGPAKRERWVCLRAPTRAPSFWTRWATCPLRCRYISSASCRRCR